MVNLGGTFDSGTIEPQKPMVPLPNGWYAMRIKESEIRDTKSDENNNRYLKLTLEIDENFHPGHKGRFIWDNLNLWNDNPTASEIAQRTLSAICRAVARPKITDSEQLHGLTVAVRVAYRPARGDYAESNDVKGYEAVAAHFAPDGAAMAAPAAGGAPAAPTAPVAGSAPVAPGRAPVAPSAGASAAPVATTPAAPSGANPPPWQQQGQQ